MEMNIGELVIFTLAIIIPGAFIMAALEVSAEQKKARRDQARARELQGK